MPEPADIPEAPALLPQGAHGLAAQRGLAVAEGTGVSLQSKKKKGGKKFTQLQNIDGVGKEKHTGYKKWNGEST